LRTACDSWSFPDHYIIGHAQTMSQ
jgi:hypothetical protein